MENYKISTNQQKVYNKKNCYITKIVIEIFINLFYNITKKNETQNL